MSQLYDRAEIYDLIENEKRTENIRKDWKQFLGERKIHSLLDVSIGTGGMTLPLQELGIEIYGSDLSEAMLSRCSGKAIAKNYKLRKGDEITVEIPEAEPSEALPEDIPLNIVY